MSNSQLQDQTSLHSITGLRDRQLTQAQLAQIPEPWQILFTTAGKFASTSLMTGAKEELIPPKLIAGTGRQLQPVMDYTMSGLDNRTIVQSLMAELVDNPHGHQYQVVLCDSMIQMPFGRTDALQFYIVCTQPELSISFAVPYARNPNAETDFAIYPLVLNEQDTPNNIEDLLTLFCRYIFEFKGIFKEDIDLEQAYDEDFLQLLKQQTGTTQLSTDANSTDSNNSFIATDYHIALDNFQYPMGTLTHIADEYLYDFFANPQQEVAYARQLLSCKLDFSLGSLQRIDKFLTALATQKQPEKYSFLEDEKQQSLIITIIFYFGEVIFRALQCPPKWVLFSELKEALPNQFPDDFHPIYSMIIRQSETDIEIAGQSLTKKDWNYFMPEHAVFFRLFERVEEASLYQEAIRVITNEHVKNSTDNTSKIPPDHLPLPQSPKVTANVNMSKALANLTPVERYYLQMPAMPNMFGETMRRQLDALGALYQHGEVVWGAIVQANKNLYNLNESSPYLAEILYHPIGRVPNEVLQHYASDLLKLKHIQSSDPDQQAIANHLKAENLHAFGQTYPKSMGKLPLKMSTIIINPEHLPNGMLSYDSLPILILDYKKFPQYQDIVTVLPYFLWESRFVNEWLKMEQANPRNQGKNFSRIEKHNAMKKNGHIPQVLLHQDWTAPNLAEVFPNHQMPLSVQQQIEQNRINPSYTDPYAHYEQQYELDDEDEDEEDDEEFGLLMQMMDNKFDVAPAKPKMSFVNKLMIAFFVLMIFLGMFGGMIFG